jgi:hypothetical protein
MRNTPIVKGDRREPDGFEMVSNVKNVRFPSVTLYNVPEEIKLGIKTATSGERRFDQTAELQPENSEL